MSGQAQQPQPQQQQQQNAQQGLPPITFYGKKILEWSRSKFLSPGNGDKTVLSLTELQRVTLYALQVNIVQHVRDLDQGNGHANTAQNWLGLTKALNAYCHAIRDLEYMIDHSTSDEAGDPFVIHKIKAPEGWPLISAQITAQDPITTVPPVMHTRRFGRRLAMQRPRSKRGESLRGLRYALAGGAALFGPTFIMVMVEGRLVNLVTTGISILVCAVVVGLMPKFSPRDSLTLTAAYASIWAVFVGTQKIGHWQIKF